MSKLKITIEEEGTYALGTQYPNYVLELSSDVKDFTVHEWFKLFEKVLLASGFSEYVVMSGACELAFNEWRDTADMRKVFKEYDLDEFVDKPEEEEEGTLSNVE